MNKKAKFLTMYIKYLRAHKNLFTDCGKQLFTDGEKESFTDD